jgi:hypothetical protein
MQNGVRYAVAGMLASVAAPTSRPLRAGCCPREGRGSACTAGGHCLQAGGGQAIHLLAVADQQASAVLAQVGVDGVCLCCAGTSIGAWGATSVGGR